MSLGGVLRKFSWLCLLSFQVISYGSYTVLIHLCEENGKIRFSSTAMNFLIELFKLAFSLACYLVERSLESRSRFNSKPIHYSNTSKFNLGNSIFFSVPGLLYFINNNLAVYIQLYMDSTSYQMLSNFKIFSTAILYYFIMGKSLTRFKWFSLVLLFGAGVFYVFGNLKSLNDYYINDTDLEELKLDTKQNEPIKFRVSDQIYITHVGILLISIYCFISGLSGVYSEYLLKKNYSDSILMQNIYLYIYGTLFNFVACAYEFDLFSLSGEFPNVFKGFNWLTWIVIFTQVFNGFLMSIVMKYSNNITRLFVISCSLVVTTVLSVLIFSLKLNFYFYIGFIAIMIALYINLNY